ncbi:1500_t:CDS:2, partial [Ambispora leptoticha]
MHIWRQASTSFVTSSYSFDNFDNHIRNNNNNSESCFLDLDILNNSSLNFVRPDSQGPSHTAAMTAARRVLRDQGLPRKKANSKEDDKVDSKSTTTNHPISNNLGGGNDNSGWAAPNSWWPTAQPAPVKSREDSLSEAHAKFSIPKAPKPHKYDTEQIKPGVHPVLFNRILKSAKIEPINKKEIGKITGDPIEDQETMVERVNNDYRVSDDRHHHHSNHKSDTKSELIEASPSSQEQRFKQHEPIPMLHVQTNPSVRRVSAPSFTYAYFSAPAANSTNPFFQSASTYGSELSTDVKSSTTTPKTVTTKTTTDTYLEKQQRYTREINYNQQRIPNISSTITTTTSKSSIVSSTTTRRSSQVQFNIPSREEGDGDDESKSISTENPFTTNHAFSAPTISSDAYSGIRSPAASWLGFLADSTCTTPMPDDEGEQVGEYILGKVIGRGGFSTVREAYTTLDSGSLEKFAVKIIKNDPDSENNDRLQALLQREIEIWRHLENPHIVRMISYEETDYATFIFAEFCPGDTLLQHIKKSSNEYRAGLDEDEAREIFLQIAEAVRYLHNDMRLVHKDIKLDNVLLSREGTWKLGDFGLTEYQNGGDSNDLNNSRRDECAGGSLAYCPPEQLRSKIPIKNPSVDIWSLGVVLYALVTGQLPYNDDFEPRLQYKILNGRFDDSPLRDANVSEDLRELLKGMFKTKPEQRLTINEVIDN